MNKLRDLWRWLWTVLTTYDAVEWEHADSPFVGRRFYLVRRHFTLSVCGRFRPLVNPPVPWVERCGAPALENDDSRLTVLLRKSFGVDVITCGPTRFPRFGRRRPVSALSGGVWSKLPDRRDLFVYDEEG